MLLSNAFNDLLRLQTELEHLLNRPAPGYLFGTLGAGVFPPVNVFRNADGVVIRAELPGLKPEDITVTSEPGDTVFTVRLPSPDRSPQDG